MKKEELTEKNERVITDNSKVNINLVEEVNILKEEIDTLKAEAKEKDERIKELKGFLATIKHSYKLRNTEDDFRRFYIMFQTKASELLNQ